MPSVYAFKSIRAALPLLMVLMLGSLHACSKPRGAGDAGKDQRQKAGVDSLVSGVQRPTTTEELRARNTDYEDEDDYEERDALARSPVVVEDMKENRAMLESIRVVVKAKTENGSFDDVRKWYRRLLDTESRVIGLSNRSAANLSKRRRAELYVDEARGETKVRFGGVDRAVARFEIFRDYLADRVGFAQYLADQGKIEDANSEFHATQLIASTVLGKDDELNLAVITPYLRFLKTHDRLDRLKLVEREEQILQYIHRDDRAPGANTNTETLSH